MNAPIILKRPTLQIKKRIQAPLASGEMQPQSVQVPIPAPVPVPVIVAPVKKAPKQSKLAAEKERRRLENMELSSLAAAKRRADIARVAPVLTAYFSSKPMLSVTVWVDGVECFRPLAVGTRHAVIAWLRTQPETVDCSATVLNDLIALTLKPHVEAPRYLAGVLKFNERFDLDGQVCGVVSAKHKANATKKQKLVGGVVEDGT